jgi:hypothetical protein
MAALDLGFCNLSPNATIALASEFSPELQYHHFAASRAKMDVCGKPAYLRPDPGGCLLPWPYTLAWVLIHLPVTVLRVRRWEKVQTLSIILAIFSIYFTLQAYTTHMSPSQIMVWMPLAIVLDIGSMMQLVFLIVEEYGVALLWAALVDSVLRPFRKRRETKLSRNSVQEEVRHSAVLNGEKGTSESPTATMPIVLELTLRFFLDQSKSYLSPQSRFPKDKDWLGKHGSPSWPSCFFFSCSLCS